MGNIAHEKTTPEKRELGLLLNNLVVRGICNVALVQLLYEARYDTHVIHSDDE